MRGSVTSIAHLRGCCGNIAPHPTCGHLPPEGEGSPQKASPFGRSCRPQAADEGRRCLYCPFTELLRKHCPSSGLGRSLGHLPPRGGRLSQKASPFGRSCRPQAADEGRCCLYCPFRGLLRKHRPSSGLGPSSATFPQRGKAHLLSFKITILSCAKSLGDTPGMRPACASVRGRIFASFSRDSSVIVSIGA